MNEGCAPRRHPRTRSSRPQHLLDRPYLPPIYDEPEFVVRNLWRLYGGWWDGNPAHLKPAPAAALARELAALAGGAAGSRRGRSRSRPRATCASPASWRSWPPRRRPTTPRVHAARAEVFGARARHEASTMSKGIFSWAEHESSQKVEPST